MNSLPFDKLRVSTRSINKVFTLSEPYISYIGRVEVEMPGIEPGSEETLLQRFSEG